MQEKKKVSMASLWALIKRHWVLFLGAGIATIINVLIGFVTPAMLAEMFDYYMGDKPSRFPPFINNIIQALFGSKETVLNHLWVFGAALIFIQIIKGIFSYLKGIWCAYASEDSAKHLRDRLYTHIQALPYAYHVSAATGDLIQRCTSDVETVRRFLNVQLMSVFNSFFMITLALALMMPVNSKITIISMIPLPFMLVFSWRFFNVVIKAYQKWEEAEGQMSTVLQENLTGIRVVRAFGQQREEVEKFEKVNNAHYQAALKTAPLDAMYWTSGDLFSAIQTLIIIGTCIVEAYHGRITVGDMVILITYSGMLMGPTRQLGRILSDAGRSLVALDRIKHVLDTPTEKEEPEAIKPPLNGDIVFHNVSFGYEDKQQVLNQINLTIQSGQTVAILGATGSGKSTLLHLLQRLYEPTSGEITIGGTPLQNIDRKYLRSRIGLVLQEPFLYSKTIRDNVSIAVREGRQPDIDKAVHDASAWEFIRQSEKGYDTLVGERGVTLSGGQKQRIAIARTLMKENDILIFDDSLSAVDTQTDHAIRRALQKRSENVTTLIVSHRVSTLSQADIIFVIENGAVTERGSHAELINQGGLYARIYDIQQGSAETPEKV